MKYFFLSVLLLFTIFGCKSKKESAEFFKRGNYHFKKNELDKAEHFFTESIKKTPDFADAYNNRGVVFLKRGNTEKALKDFEKAVNLDASFVDAKFNLAKILSESGEYKRAEMIFKSLESKMKNSSDFYNQMGQNAIRQNHFDEGLKLLEKSFSLNPGNVETLTNISYLFLIQNREVEALKFVDKALKINPDFGFALNNKAVISGRNRSFKEAINLLEKALLNDPKNLVFINNLTLYCLENKDLENGLIYLQKAKKIDEANPYTLRNMGVYFFYSGKKTEALKIFQEIERSNPEVDHIYYFLALNTASLKDNTSACKFRKRAASLSEPWLTILPDC